MHYRLEYDNLGIVDINVGSSVSTESQKNGNIYFSLVIPAFQEEKLIESQLLRFPVELRSKYGFELIVSDGGSTDRTVEISRKYADKVVVHSEARRQTISEGRNRGAEVACGEVIVFLNADSYPQDSDDFFRRIKQWTLSPNNAEAALACYVSGFPEEILLKDKIFYTLHNAYVQMLNLFGMGMGRGECQIVRRDAFNKVGGYNNSIVAGEDFDLYRRLNKISKVKFDKDLVVLESPRRFRKYGYIKTLLYWTLNSITVMCCNKSISKEWEAVR